jgi:putative transposase
LDDLPFPLPLEWNKVVNEPLSEKELIKIERSINQQTPFGDEKWQRDVCKKYQLEHTMRPRGRPKKQSK